jgi:hypothetical protein
MGLTTLFQQDSQCQGRPCYPTPAASAQDGPDNSQQQQLGQQQQHIKGVQHPCCCCTEVR